MKKIACFMVTLCAGLCAMAQQSYTARVVDAASGEPLPMASIFHSAGNGTLANEEGSFSIAAKEGDMLRISHIGYETQRIKASRLPRRVRMKPLEGLLREVRPIPVEQLMAKLVRRLNAENSSHAAARSQYFYRITNLGPRHESVIEAFLSAYSTININAAAVLSGRTFSSAPAEPGNETTESFRFPYQHDIFELGPEIPPGCRSPLSMSLNLPLPEWAKEVADFAGREMKCTVLESSNEGQIYRIDIQVDPHISALAGEKYLPLSDEKALSGTLYVKKRPLRLLSFDGQLTGCNAIQGDGTEVPVNIRLHIDYKHSRRFTEPVVLHCVMECGDYASRMLAFKVNKPRLLNLQAYPAGDNLAEAIKQTKYRPKLWDEEIIQRTTKEDQIVREAAGRSNAYGFPVD